MQSQTGYHDNNALNIILILYDIIILNINVKRVYINCSFEIRNYQTDHDH